MRPIQAKIIDWPALPDGEEDHEGIKIYLTNTTEECEQFDQRCREYLSPQNFELQTMLHEIDVNGLLGCNPTEDTLIRRAVALCERNSQGSELTLPVDQVLSLYRLGAVAERVQNRLLGICIGCAINLARALDARLTIAEKTIVVDS